MSEATAADAIPKIDPAKIRLVDEHKLSRPLTACCWEPQNRFILVGSEDNGIVRFHLDSKAAVPMVGPHDSWVRAIGTSPDGQVTFTGGYDGRLLWWPTAAEKPEPIRVIDAHAGWIRALAVSGDGRQLATCGNDRLVRLWDAQSGALLSVFEGHQWHVYNVAFSPSGDRLVSCDLKGFVKVWNPRSDDDSPNVPGLVGDLAHLESLHKYDSTFRADIGGARCMAFSTDAARLAIGGVTNVTNAFAGVGDAVVALVDIADGEVVVQYGPSEKLRGTAWGIAQHGEDFWIGLAGGGGGGWFYFWRGDQPGEFFKYKLKNDGRGMSLSPDATRIAVAHADNHLRVYALFDPPAAS